MTAKKMHNAASVTLTYVKMEDVVKDGEENAQCRVHDSHLC